MPTQRKGSPLEGNGPPGRADSDHVAPARIIRVNPSELQHPPVNHGDRGEDEEGQGT